MDHQRRIHVIACGVLAIDLKAAAEKLGVEASMEFLPGGLHSRPHELRRRLQEAVDRASAAGGIEAIAIGYGVCGMGLVGIHARGVPLAVPRVNDCIALFLGSDAAYREQFARYPGTYYISAGWVEEKAPPQSTTAWKSREPEETGEQFDRLVARHGRENAEAIRYFLTSWQRNYQRAAFIDTGRSAEGRRKYARIARAMAEEFGWKYEELRGTDELLTRLLTQRSSSDEVLVVPPHHVTAYDPVTKGLKAAGVWEGDIALAGQKQKLIFAAEGDAPPGAEAPGMRLGLGIDAGGTYTDAVIFDFRREEVIDKAKALTTKWDLGVGIDAALDRLDAERLRRVDLVAISTTLATNAIVEGRGQKVGLLIMPPYGLFDPADIAHRPIAILDAKMEIDGTEIAPVDAEQVRRVVSEMVEKHRVGAFAVTGYASHNNPSHERQVRDIIRGETRLAVTCGHEVSEGLNYRVRAATAALNARIIPCLQALLESVQASLERRGIDAPRMVVKSDGSLIGVEAALRRPIETILSGPAASVAGACHLAGARDAIVVDIGGTTTDTATIEDGLVRTCRDGASIGGWRTHVKALDMRTLGLGGDSHVVREKRKLHIGPRRVAPVSWLIDRHPEGAAALDWLERHVDYFSSSTRGADLLAVNGHAHQLTLSDQEARIVELLSDRPYSLHELAHRTGCVAWQFLPLARLEEHCLVQPCGLTPTDALHTAGRVELWDADAARRLCDLFARLSGIRRDDFAECVLRQAVRKLAVELIKKQLDGRIDPDEIDRSPAAMALIRNSLDGGSDACRVRVTLRRPIIGIGAPVHCFLPQAARLLETEAVIPPHADVASAIGAVTSSVCVNKQVRIAPNDRGLYAVYGLPDAPAFRTFQDAHEFAVEQILLLVRRAARRAGTSETTVEIALEDKVASVSDGGRIFVGRTLAARLT
ncbi:MAG: hydantoinase/oxoprolinase family protein, partial [Phycisphaerae bacterium]